MIARAVTLLMIGLASPVGPPVALEDLARFPSMRACEEVCPAGLAAEHAFRRRAEAAAHEDDRRHWERASHEACRLWWAWDSLRWAQDPQRPLSIRLHWLDEVRRILGPTAWYAGQMPPAVPYWYFRSAD